MTITSMSASIDAVIQPDGSFYVVETITDDVAGSRSDRYLAPAGWTQQQIDGHLSARSVWWSDTLADLELQRILNG